MDGASSSTRNLAYCVIFGNEIRQDDLGAIHGKISEEMKPCENFAASSLASCFCLSPGSAFSVFWRVSNRLLTRLMSSRLFTGFLEVGVFLLRDGCSSDADRHRARPASLQISSRTLTLAQQLLEMR
jgi:hypothetical protein